MIDRINTEKFEDLCNKRSITLEALALEVDVNIKTLQRAQSTGYIPSTVLKSICRILDVKPKELTRRMPISIGGMDGLN